MKVLRLKEFTFAVISMLLLFAVSCEKNEGSTSMLVGTWSFSESTIEITVDGVDFADYLLNELGYTEQQVQELMDIYESGGPSEIVFRKDGTYTVYFTYDDPESGTWKLSADNKVLTITTDGEDTVLDVYSLTATLLIVDMNMDEMDDLNGDGIDEHMVYLSRMTFTR